MTQLLSCGRMSDFLGRNAFVKRTGAILTNKVSAEVTECKTAICQPTFRFLRRDQIMTITKLLCRSRNGRLVQLQFQFVGTLFRRDVTEKCLPFFRKLASENSCIDRIARCILVSSARAHNYLVRRNRLCAGHERQLFYSILARKSSLSLRPAPMALSVSLCD